MFMTSNIHRQFSDVKVGKTLILVMIIALGLITNGQVLKVL